MNYRPAREGGRFASWVGALRGQSGVYVFRSAFTNRVLYVGESHTGNLDRTIKRHFWTWADRTARHHYSVGIFPVEVGVRVVPARIAVDLQERLIRRLAPAHNKTAPTDVVPF